MATTTDLQTLAETRWGLRQAGDPPVLLNHPAQSATAIDGWKSALFGVPFLAVGIAIGSVALNKISAHKNAPDWLIGIFAGAFFFGGLFFFVHGLRGIARKAAWKRAAAHMPGEPWLYDHHWHREGVAYSAFDEMLKRLLGALGWNLFLAPFAWVGMHGPRLFLVVACLFALFGLFLWARWWTMLRDLARFGNSFLNYEGFPYSLGGTLHAQLRTPRHVEKIDELKLILRCVQEKYVTTRGADNRSTTQVVCYELYSDVATLDHARLAGLAGGPIPVEFRVPSDQPQTNLAATPPVYWEIEANGKARGADYQAYFLVPIYKTS
ncbi:MAG TPA: hypothetical protein VHX36_08015 [Candidatus Acidoferrales bacterium]|jgi:hypothetical protein|nr:hypothetical protein [Candidatus Acidoferrales bacterium]